MFKNIFPKLVFSLIFGFAFLLVFQARTYAAQFHFQDYTLEKDTVVKDDVYVAASSATINGVIEGDLIITARDVIVSGTITGDVYVFGYNVNVDGNVYGNTALFGYKVSTSGLYSNNLYMFGAFNTFDGEVGKDMLSFAMESSLNGSVGDDLKIFGARTNTETIVKGDLLSMNSMQSIKEENVSGDIYYDTTLEAIAKEQGVDLEKKVVEKEKETSFIQDLGTKVAFAFMGFLGIGLVGVLFIYAMPVKTVEIRRRISDSPQEFFKSFILGFAVYLLLPLPLIVLGISIVGAPLAILLGGILSFVAIFGRIWVEVAFGKELLELFKIKEYRPFRSFLVGRVLSTIIGLIPIVGFFYNVVVICTALGAMIRTKKFTMVVASNLSKEVKTPKKITVKKKAKK